ncbi:hypothetical protein HOE04_00595 [archaeon]|nr:hypothetical protein [archaeon]
MVLEDDCDVEKREEIDDAQKEISPYDSKFNKLSLLTREGAIVHGTCKGPYY